MYSKNTETLKKFPFGDDRDRDLVTTETAKKGQVSVFRRDRDIV